MAKGGFKLLDSDMHIVEPPDLWERYIDPAFKAQAPRGWPGPENPSVLEVAGKVMPRIAATPEAHYQTMYARKADRYRLAIERNFDPGSQLEAMDTEGIDVAVLFPTRGLYALATDDLEPDLAAAIARAYNDTGTIPTTIPCGRKRRGWAWPCAFTREDWSTCPKSVGASLR
jgi:hypothetical protein